MLWQKFLRKITLNKNLFNILDSVNRNDDKLLRTQVETVKPRAMDLENRAREADAIIASFPCSIQLSWTIAPDQSA